MLEGPAGRLTAVIRFADKAAEAWYHSDDYQAVIGIRRENNNGTMVLADGIEARSS